MPVFGIILIFAAASFFIWLGFKIATGGPIEPIGGDDDDGLVMGAFVGSATMAAATATMVNNTTNVDDDDDAVVASVAIPVMAVGDATVIDNTTYSTVGLGANDPSLLDSQPGDTVDNQPTFDTYQGNTNDTVNSTPMQDTSYSTPDTSSSTVDNSSSVSNNC